MAGYFDLKKASNGKFMFNLKAGNNQVVLTSETYSSKDAAEAGIAAVKKNASADKNYDRKTAKNGESFFVLKSADNGRVIGNSETYTSTAGMEKGVKAVMAAAKGAKTKES